MRSIKKVSRKKMAVVIVLLVSVGLFLVVYLNRINEGQKNGDHGHIVDASDRLNMIIGERKESVICDAGELKGREIDYTPCVSLKDMSTDSNFLQRMKESIGSWAAEDSDTFLYGQEGCFLSINPVYLFDCRERKLGNLVFCYIFTESGEEAGAIMFSREAGKATWSITLNSVSLRNRSDILKFLARNPDEKYIVLMDTYEHMFLNQDNEIYAWGKEQKVVGDYYGALDSEFLEVSYNMIMNEENWIWIKF